MSKYDLIVLGNPLLDISAKVDDELLAKYDLKMDNVILAEEKHLPLYKELQAKPDVEYLPGGAGQNSARVCNWMLPDKQVAYIGCVGDDEYATKMREICKTEGMATFYAVDKETPTGTCAACIQEGERSLVANLAAANNFKIDNMEGETWDAVVNSKMIYTTGFHITVCPDAQMKMAKHCIEASKKLAINLSAPFIMEVPPFKAVLGDLVKHAAFIFGNENECQSFAKSEGWTETSNEDIIVKIANMESVEGVPERTVIITQGSESTLVCTKGQTKCTIFPVVPLAKEELVDTNGAGDAFVGGFLAGLAKNVGLEECIKAGSYAAKEIIKQPGCTLPEKLDFLF